MRHAMLPSLIVATVKLCYSICLVISALLHIIATIILGVLIRL